MTKDAQAIFVVGPDTVGKTTVTTVLSSMLGLPRFKCPAEKEMFRTATFREHLSFDLFLPHFVSQTRSGFVSDRGYPCEFAYSRALGRETDTERLERIDELWAERDALIVILLKGDYAGSNDDLVDDETLRRVHEGYLDFAAWTRSKFMVIYSDDHKTPDWAEHIAERIVHRVSMYCVPVEPTTDRERQLYDALLDAHVLYTARHLSPNDAADYNNIREAYLYLTSGNTRRALETLFRVPRELLPQDFWEALGRSW